MGVLQELVGFSLRRASQQVVTQMSGDLVTLAVRPLQFAALSIVVDNPGIIQRSLANALGIERSNMVVLVDELEMREFITRNHVEGDRRSYALHPTSAGVRFRTKALTLIRKHDTQLLASLTQTERGQLLTLLHRIGE